MIKKITDKDKEDWENFLHNNKKTPNNEVVKKKDLSDKKIKEISDKDKDDWQSFHWSFFFHLLRKFPNLSCLYLKFS